jgi:hypothetical protein
MEILVEKFEVFPEKIRNKVLQFGDKPRILETRVEQNGAKIHKKKPKWRK